MNGYNLFQIGNVAHANNKSYISIYDEYKSALLHIDDFSHAIVLYIDTTRTSRDSEHTAQEHSEDVIKHSLRHSLSQIKLTTTRILKADLKFGTLVTTTNAIPPGAAIVDIKPYFPIEDRVRDCITPSELACLPPFMEEGKNLEVGNNGFYPNDATRTNEDLMPSIHPVGVIRKHEGRCIIEINEPNEGYFHHFNQFSHIQIVWWFSRFSKDSYRKTTVCNPPYEKAPKTGVFASRSPVRPNPIGLTTTRILEIDSIRNTIEVTPVDAFDNTPVLDIRPYIPYLNRVRTCTVPTWVDHWSEWYVEHIKKINDCSIILNSSDFKKLESLADIIESPEETNESTECTFHVDHSRGDHIVVVGAKENNLKDVSLHIPKNKMTVITGLSGSGKSSLAFDTIYAESQRRFMDSLSSTGRQFFKQFEKPNVDQIENLPPAIAVEQKSISKSARSTVGTVSDINDFLRLLYARVGVRHCPQCGRAVEVKTMREIVRLLTDLSSRTSFSIVSLKDNQSKYAYTVNHDGDNTASTAELKRVVMALLKIDNGAFKVRTPDDGEFILHTRNHCYYCGISFFELSPSLFSSNSPESMCSECDGLGTKMNVSPDLVVSNPGRSILDGASEWWGHLRRFIEKPTGNWMKGEVVALAQSMSIDLEMPWSALPIQFREQALYGSNGVVVNLKFRGSKGRAGDINRPVEGAVNHIKRLFRGSHGRGSGEFYVQFMEQIVCPACHGEQLNAESRFVTVADARFPEIASMSIDSLHEWIHRLPHLLSNSHMQVSREVVDSVSSKTEALMNVGLHYLTLKRSLSTLSGGEAQRLRLSTQLGCGLTNLLYILDEPSVGLHPCDHRKLIDTMKRLRDRGNTLIIVEHDAATMLEADHLIEIGPGAGINGGYLVAQGTPEVLMENANSITGRYLSKERIVGANPGRARRTPYGFLTIKGACKNNLKKISVSFPLGMFICVTGKSGSGKSSLVTKTISPVLSYFYGHKVLLKGDYDAIEGLNYIDNVVTITQEAIGRSPRSNPATYSGVFDEIREVFASTPSAKGKRYTASRFSFNSTDGRCESCNGEGRTRVEMNFMPDVWITCPDCGGRRFNKDTLRVKYREKTIADVLEMDIAEASILFEEYENITSILNTFRDVGLGYLKLGQSALTLSGGEAQRVKLSKELSRSKKGKVLYILDEPATGLHFADIDHLLVLIRRIVDAGNTVIVIEHNTDIVKNSDWIIDLGPEGGDSGGYIIYEGPPEAFHYTQLELHKSLP